MCRCVGVGVCLSVCVMSVFMHMYLQACEYQRAISFFAFLKCILPLAWDRISHWPEVHQIGKSSELASKLWTSTQVLTLARKQALTDWAVFQALMLASANSAPHENKSIFLGGHGWTRAALIHWLLLHLRPLCYLGCVLPTTMAEKQEQIHISLC